MKNKTRTMMFRGLAVIIAIMGWRMAGAEATVVSPVDGLSENGGFGCYYGRYVSR